MTLDELAEFLERNTEDFQRAASHWQFVHDDVPMACLTDPEFDRMRFIAPVTEYADLSEGLKDAVLEANFHTTLDARYAASNGLLFAAFIHPLGSLEPDLARSGLEQVASLVNTFGTEFSSGVLEFVGGGDHDDDDDDDDDNNGSGGREGGGGVGPGPGTLLN